MNLKGLEFTAMLSAGMILSNVDDQVSDDEKEILVKELASFDVTDQEADIYLDIAIDLSLEHTIEILKAMSPEAKKYACGYLGAVMLSDGEVGDVEMEGWRKFSSACEFPTMTLGEALAFWRNN